MRKSKSQQLHEYWQQQLKQWKKSGVSGLKYCKLHNLSYHRFNYWRSKLSRIESREDQSSDPVSPPSSFVRVVQRDECVSDLLITLPNGIMLRGITADHIPLVGQLMQQ